MQGTTFVMSSGDYGVGSYPGDDNLTTGCAGPDGKIFWPQTSSTCPYVLSVGSTVFQKNPLTNSTCNLIEVSTPRFASGGGFSNYFPAPAYQTAAIAEYFAETPLSFSGYTSYSGYGPNFTVSGNGVYHIGGRGYPDVSAIGDNFVFRSGGQWGLVGGTSLSAPVWGAVLTRINEERILAGKKPVGYVNPVFVSTNPSVSDVRSNKADVVVQYANPEVFTDITQGSNPNCNSTGFITNKGWDPVSGLGSPIYPKLLALYMSLP
jgi:tripeptidyl-peptidase I